MCFINRTTVKKFVEFSIKHLTLFTYYHKKVPELSSGGSGCKKALATSMFIRPSASQTGKKEVVGASYINILKHESHVNRNISIFSSYLRKIHTHTMRKLVKQ
jgi:hypothetical protein